MAGMLIIILTAMFVAVFGGTMLLLREIAPGPAQQRLQRLGGDHGNERASGAWITRIARLSRPFAKWSRPAGEASALRMRFMNAGFHGARAPVIYFGAKTLLAIMVPGLLAPALVLSGALPGAEWMLLSLTAAAAAGFYFPDLLLARMTAARQREILEQFPDALDLMVICVEAGLAIDAAIARVAEEIAISAATVSEELHLVMLELRAGSSKENAWRNLALRTGVEEIEMLVTVLVQTERFGTGIGDALRVHSAGLRTRRRQRAEEAAAKIALKLLFPLIFCIFPSLLLVLLGPAMIQVYRVLLPTMAGQ
ncbi:MAG: type secretion system protein [Herminiimonas sp.]|nr:type secretion system protein [Herminiimonas sp.]